MSFTFPNNITVVGASTDGNNIYFNDIRNPNYANYKIKNFYEENKNSDMYLQNSCELIFSKEGGFIGSTPLNNYRNKVVYIDKEYSKDLLQKYFDSEMLCQFQQYIPEFDRDQALKRFIEVCSSTVKGFHFKDWLKEFNYVWSLLIENFQKNWNFFYCQSVVKDYFSNTKIINMKKEQQVVSKEEKISSFIETENKG